MANKILDLFRCHLKKKHLQVKNSHAINAPETAPKSKDLYVIVKKIVINIPDSPPLILERVYVNSVSISIAKTDYMSLEINDKKNGGYQKYYINPKFIVLMEV